MILGATIRLNDRFTSTLTNIRKDTNDLKKRMDTTGQTVSKTTSKLKILGRTTARPVIKVKNEATAAIGKVKNSLMSLRGLATIAITVVGIDRLGKATLGSAMNMQRQQISMEHWLKGNAALAREATNWLEKYAAATPFGMEDLFPAMTRGIGITDGDVKLAKRLVALSADMAALTPGKTVQDAMEALADASMGEFERLKEFNMKISQEEFKALGGMIGLVAKAEKVFSGGSDKLSKSGFGLLSTIADNVSIFFRKTGEGVLTSMMPRLEKVTKWFDEHPKTVEKWQKSLVRFGKQAGEFMFSRLEKAFDHINKKYIENPEFTKLSFTGKINFILEDITEGFKRWLDEGGADKVMAFGADIGTLIGEGLISVAPTMGRLAADALISAISAGLKSSPLGAAALGALGGAAIGSVVPGVGTLVGGVVGGAAGVGTWGVSKGIDAASGEGKKNALGLRYVPRDNYPALLHKGEAVLARRDADQHRAGSGSLVLEKLAETLVIREDADIDKIVNAIERKWRLAIANRGRVAIP